MEVLAVVGLVVIVVVMLAVVLIPLIALGSIINGYVLRILWGWFIVPIFHLPSLTIAQAIGLSMVVGLLTHRSRNSDGREKTEKEKKKELISFIAELFLFPFITLGVGWIVHQYT